MLRVNFLIFFLALPLQSATAQPEFLFGMGVHLAQGRNDGAFVQRLINGKVINSFRDDLYWSRAERTRGVIDFPSSLRRLDDLIFSSAGKAFPLLILDYGNDNYGGGFPLSEEAKAGFVEYAGAAASRYRDHVFAFEIWNEWNIGAGNRKYGGRHGDPGKYVELVVQTARAIRESAPDVKVICGAVADLDTEWIRNALKRGMLLHCDGLSVHPYVYSNGRGAYPKNVFQWLDGIASMVAEAPGGSGKKIYVTELGWPTHTGKGGFTEENAADFLIQSLALAKSKEYLAGLWWYELTNGKDDNPHDRESNFGVYRKSYDHKAAAAALEATAQLIRSGVFEAEGKIGANGQWVRLGVNQSAETLIVVWGRTGETEGYCLQISNADEVFDVGAKKKLVHGTLLLASTDRPLVLRFGGKTALSSEASVKLARNGRCH